MYKIRDDEQRPFSARRLITIKTRESPANAYFLPLWTVALPTFYIALDGLQEYVGSSDRTESTVSSVYESKTVRRAGRPSSERTDFRSKNVAFPVPCPRERPRPYGRPEHGRTRARGVHVIALRVCTVDFSHPRDHAGKASEPVGRVRRFHVGSENRFRDSHDVYST